jgi:uncharacterized protein (DUF2236 family)
VRRARAEHMTMDALLRDAIAGSGMFANANVVMQLARLPVGRGVAESTVDSGRVELHPLKRARTTGSYLIVALLGSDRDREVMRNEVNRQHRGVRSDGPVAYNAFDGDLQLWVASCLYAGFSTWLELFRGPLSEDQRDELYGECSRLGTTLQVPEESWPADREAFWRYFRDGVAAIEMDDVTRTHLTDLTMLRHLPLPVRAALAPLNRSLTMGFLPEEFRRELGIPWTARQQRRFDRAMRMLVRVEPRLPRRARHVLLDAYEASVNSRIRDERAIV